MCVFVSYSDTFVDGNRNLKAQTSNRIRFYSIIIITNRLTHLISSSSSYLIVWHNLRAKRVSSAPMHARTTRRQWRKPVIKFGGIVSAQSAAIFLAISIFFGRGHLFHI